MKPGAYAFCRKIDKALVGAHQFVVLVPEKSTTLNGLAQEIAGVRCAVIGAYAIGGYLRARPSAPSDVAALARKLKAPQDAEIQMSRVEVQACLISEDSFLEYVYRAYTCYRTFEGTKKEIAYPAGKTTWETVKKQLSPSSYNSNSWAQSLLHWAGMMFVPGEFVRDFNGLDLANDRLIPKEYFVAPK